MYIENSYVCNLVRVTDREANGRKWSQESLQKEKDKLLVQPIGHI